MRPVLPSNLVSTNAPLSPVTQKSIRGGFVQNGYSPRTPRLDKAILGSYGRREDQPRSGITLQFKVPRGTQGIDLQVAGYPNAGGIALKVEEHHQASYSIAPSLDPGDNWQTISVRLNPKSTSFKISAKDQSDGAWLAFSMPTVSNGHAPGQWARLLANNSFYFLASGLVLLLLGGLAAIANQEPVSDAVSSQNAP